MPQLGKFHLQLALVRTGPLREDVEDQPGTIQDPALEFALQIALLAGRQRMIEDSDFTALRLDRGADLLELAAADVQPRVRLHTGALNEGDGFCARGPDQLNEFPHFLLVGVAAG